MWGRGAPRRPSRLSGRGDLGNPQRPTLSVPAAAKAPVNAPVPPSCGGCQCFVAPPAMPEGVDAIAWQTTGKHLGRCVRFPQSVAKPHPIIVLNFSPGRPRLMPDSQGTRSSQNLFKSRIEQGTETRGHQQDVGMSKRKVTRDLHRFQRPHHRLEWRFCRLRGERSHPGGGHQPQQRVQDCHRAGRTNQAYLTVDPAPKDEGPVANTLVRTA
jgi:hypothetical protein